MRLGKYAGMGDTMTDDEARDIEDEARYWREYKPANRPNCLFVLATLLLLPALLGGGAWWWL